MLYLQPRPPTVSGRFVWFIEALRQCIATRISNKLPWEEIVEPLEGPFIIAVHTRLGRLARRFAKLVQQARDGTLPKPRLRPPAPGVRVDAVPQDIVPSGTAPASATSAAAAAAAFGVPAGALAGPAAPGAGASAGVPPQEGPLTLPRGFGWLIQLRRRTPTPIGRG